MLCWSPEILSRLTGGCMTFGIIVIIVVIVLRGIQRGLP